MIFYPSPANKELVIGFPNDSIMSEASPMLGPVAHNGHARKALLLWSLCSSECNASLFSELVEHLLSAARRVLLRAGSLPAPLEFVVRLALFLLIPLGG